MGCGRRWSAGLAAVGVLVAAAAGRSGAADLGIGSPAPAIDVEHWFESAAGAGPIRSFDPGRIYVVEFWATWCPPCRDSIPHLAAMQERLAADGVTVIGVSDEDVDTVEEFLATETGDTSFGALTRKYRLATDPDGSVNHDYMEAAGQGGIPTAFIVGRTGAIEWIGHPHDMDGPLAKIVAGTWDRAAHAAEIREQVEIESRIEEISALVDEGKPGVALDLVDGLLPRVASAGLKSRLAAIRTQLAIRAGGPGAVAAFTAAVAAAGDTVEALNELAWAVVQLGADGGKPAPELVAAAAAAAGRAAALAPDDGSVLDTLAHLQDMQGDLDAALATERQAARHAGEFAPEINAYLDELERRAAGK